MGVCLAYCRVSPRNALCLLEHPILIHRFLGRDEADLPPAGGFWKSIFGGRRAVPEGVPSLEPRPDDDDGDTDKAWNAIHYILTGSAQGGEFPAGFILHGGRPVGTEEAGYGPARLFDTGEAAEIAKALRACDHATFYSRFDGAAMDQAKVYPQIWSRSREESTQYVWESLNELRYFVEGVVESRQWLMLYFT